MIGSLTGAVGSKKITEPNQRCFQIQNIVSGECNSINTLDCEIDGSNRYESRI